MLTPRCNMRCDFCGAEAGFDAMPYREASALVKNLAATGVESVVLGGGEPFLWGEDLLGLATLVRQQGMLAQVGTNGSLIPEGAAVLEGFDRWILPIESLHDLTHNAMRRLPAGHLEKVMQVMDRLRRAGSTVTISSLVTQENFDRLLEIGAYLQWYQRNDGKVHAWHLYRFQPVGRGGESHADQFSTAPGVFGSLGASIKEKYGDLKVYLRPDMYHSRQTSFYWWEASAMKSLQASGAL